MMTVEGSGSPSTGTKAKAEAPGKEAAVCADCREAAAAEKAGKGDGPYCKIHWTKGHISWSVIRLSSSSRGRGLNMRSMIRKKVRMALAGRVEAVKEITPARLFGTKENPPGAKRRKVAMMRLMEGMKRKPASRNSRRPLTTCALTGVHLCTPLTANLNCGRVKSMPWS